jgi:HEAT repeat protein
MAYCALTGEVALEEIVPLLGELDLPTRQAAIVGLMKYAGISGVMESATTLKKMFESSDPVEREAGAAVLGSLQVKNYYQPLLPLLDDPDEAVQTRALRSAGILKHPALIPKLIQKLGNPRHARYARAALVAFGPGIEHQLAVPLADSSHPAMQIATAKVLREVHIPASAELLAKYFFDPNDHLRAAVAQALAHLQADGVPLGIKRSELLRAALAEIKRTYSMRLLRMDLGQDCGQALDRILQDHLVYILDHLFSVLTLLYPTQDMRAIHRVLVTGGAQKANALELIDTLTDKEIKETLLPLVEAPTERVVQIAISRFGLMRLSAEQRLDELAQSTDPILRAFAIQRLGVMGTDSLKAVILQNMEYPHALVQESTAWAIAYGADPKDMRLLLEKQLNSGFASVRNYASRLLEETG